MGKVVQWEAPAIDIHQAITKAMKAYGASWVGAVPYDDWHKVVMALQGGVNWLESTWTKQEAWENQRASATILELEGLMADNHANNSRRVAKLTKQHDILSLDEGF